MELKYTNANSEIVLARKLNHVELFFSKIMIIEFKNKSKALFLQKVAMIAQKTRFSISSHPKTANQIFLYKHKYNL